MQKGTPTFWLTVFLFRFQVFNFISPFLELFSIFLYSTCTLSVNFSYLSLEGGSPSFKQHYRLFYSTIILYFFLPRYATLAFFFQEIFYNIFLAFFIFAHHYSQNLRYFIFLLLLRCFTLQSFLFFWWGLYLFYVLFPI